MKHLWLLLLLPVIAVAAGEDGGTKKTHGKATAPKLDLGLPTFGDIPKGADVNGRKADNHLDGPTVTASNAAYSVVRIQHAKAFIRTPSGSQPASPLEAIPLSGKPPTTEKFTTVVRIKSPQRTAASIELAIVDARGDTLMSSSGQLTFRGTKGDEIDYAIDWDPTPCRAGGDFQVLVRIAGQALGTYPLKFADPK